MFVAATTLQIRLHSATYFEETKVLLDGRASS